MSSFSSHFNAGDIVQVFFPFSEGEAGKARPVLIVVGPDANQDFVGLAITGSGHHNNTIALGPQDLASGKLSKASYVRADKLYTVNTQAISQEFGKVKPALLDKARKQMCSAIGCTKG
jgi:mRNA-degrading endonuclease toxin of MazEF toxin-antitoxin module